MSRRLADLSTLTIDLERNLPVLSLIEVGECVKFKPKTIEYADLEGKYILWSTDIWFRRDNNWQTTAQVKLIRTNKRAGDTIKPKTDFSLLPIKSNTERIAERLASGFGISRDDIDSLTAGPTVEQVTQSQRGRFRHPDSIPLQDREEIRNNMATISRLSEKNFACGVDSTKTGCSDRDIRLRNSQIEQLRKRNLFLSTNR